MAVCRSCQAPIIWATTSNGKSMPVDAVPVDEGNVELHWPGAPQLPIRATVHAQRPLGLTNVPLHLSHFATCPNAAEHRNRPTKENRHGARHPHQP